MSDQSPLFLTPQELADLTGRHYRSLQIAALRQMGIPFHVNALGRPVVTRAAIVGTRQQADQGARGWSPRVVTG